MAYASIRFCVMSANFSSCSAYRLCSATTVLIASMLMPLSAKWFTASLHTPSAIEIASRNSLAFVRYRLNIMRLMTRFSSWTGFVLSLPLYSERMLPIMLPTAMACCMFVILLILPIVLPLLLQFLSMSLILFCHDLDQVGIGVLYEFRFWATSQTLRFCHRFF